MPGNKRIHIPVAVISIFIICCSSVELGAQNYSRPDLIRVLLSNQLPIGNQNWEITRNPVNGFMYFANSTGLIEYNGISSRLFTMPFGQGIRSVYADKSGTLYTGSFEEFGFWKEDGMGGFVYNSLTKGIQVPKNDEIWNILELNGTVYFQSFTTIYACKDTHVKLIRAPSIMLFIFRTGNEFIIQGLGTGLFRFNGEQFEFIKESEIFATREVLAIIELPENELWIGTSNDGIYSFKNGIFTQLNNEISVFLRNQTCNAGLSLNDSLMVFGTILNGIAFCNSKGEIVKAYNYANGLNNNTVLSLFKDREQDLWIGLDEGVNYINPDSPYEQFADKNGSLGTIYTVIRKQNLLYLGTNHGLFVADIDKVNGEYHFSNLSLIPNTQGQVWKLYEFGDQLFCGHNEGTFLLDGRSMVKISNVTGGWSFTGYHDLLLQGTYTGIIAFQKKSDGNWSFRGRISGFGEPTRYLLVDYLGYLWAIHPQKGIYRLELNETGDSILNRAYYNTIGTSSGKTSISMINNQVVFMTSENIYSFDAENHTFFPVRSLEPGLGEYIKADQIIPYEKSSYWFMLDDKIALFDISKSFEARKVHELVQNYTNLPGRDQQIIALDRTNLLIPTRQAFTLFNLATARIDSKSPGPLITRMIFSGKEKNRVIIPKASENIMVPSRENNLTVYVADPSDFDLGEKTILYRIPALDNTWRKVIPDNFSFLNLMHGNYRMQVRSLNSKEITELEFTIQRPWYLSWVAWISYALILTGLTWLGIKIFKIELNHHRQLIEYEVRKNKLENELDYKNYELMLTMRYLIRKTEILKELQLQIDSLKEDSSKYPVKFVREMERIIRNGLDSQTEEWKNVMNNLKLSQEGFFRRLKENFPDLTPNDMRLCSYLRMNFTTKEIAHLLNISGRAVEIGRYRLRLKMHLDHRINLTEFLIRIF